MELYKEKVIRLLDASKLSQQSLAEQLGVSFVSLNSWVNDKTQIRRKDIVKKIDKLYDEVCLHNDPVDTVMIGDNLKCLKQLFLAGAAIDVIYIDPPYNTKNKFSFNDSRSVEDWTGSLALRLNVAAKILKNDGVIFISIDDSSLCSLRTVCDNVFGNNNFLGMFITKQAVRSNSKHINTIHEYVVAYAKDKKILKNFKIKRTDDPHSAPMIKDITGKVKKEFLLHGKKNAEKLLQSLNEKYILQKNSTWLRNYSQVDEFGRVFFAKDLSVPGVPEDLYVEEIGLRLPALPTRKWSSAKKILNLYHEDKLFFKGDRPYEKHYLEDSYDNVSSVLDFYSRQGTNDLNKLGLRDLFDTPKPVELIKYLIRIATYGKNEAIVLDFFAGSGTTGQAVMEIDKEDQKNYLFYLAQLDEKVNPKSKQYAFARRNNIEPTVDQLMLYRLNTVRKKLQYNKELSVRLVQ